MALKITTNNQPRDILVSSDLTEKELEEFDYILPDMLSDASFFRYKGHVYDLGEFIRTPQNEPARQELNELSDWDGYTSDSYFSGIVVKYAEDYMQVIVGRYTS